MTNAVLEDTMESPLYVCAKYITRSVSDESRKVDALASSKVQFTFYAVSIIIRRINVNN